MTRRIYFLSTGRAGTTYLSLLLSESLGASVTHQKSGSRVLNIIGNISWQTGLGRRSLSRFLVNSFGNNHIPESTADPLRSLSLVSFLKDHPELTDVLIIHVVRDPRTCVTSFMNWKRMSIKRTILHHFVPFWQPLPILEGGFNIRKLFISKFEHFCWIWNYKNRVIANTFKDDPRYKLIRYEDIIDQSKQSGVLEELLTGHTDKIITNRSSITSERVNKSVEGRFPSWPKWTPDQCKILHEHCFDLMQTFGYGKESNWLKKIS